MGHLESEEEEDFFEDLEALWAKLEKDSRVVFGCGQFERGETGRLHGQIYLEFEKSLRVTQVRKVIEGNWESRRGTRTQCRDYCTKSETRVEALPDYGKFRKERSAGGVQAVGPKARAMDYIVRQGLSPAEIAVLDPECYFTFHHSIRALWDALGDTGRSR
jgi:hypothetical protein